jgi:hypothetical protein
VGPAGPEGPGGPWGPFAFHEIAVVLLGQLIPVSCMTNRCDPLNAWFDQQPWITPDVSMGPPDMTVAAATPLPVARISVAAPAMTALCPILIMFSPQPDEGCGKMSRQREGAPLGSVRSATTVLQIVMVAAIVSHRGEEAPRGKALEDLAVAVMSVSGYYMSAQLVERPYGDDEVLELDALAVRLGGRAGGEVAHRVTVEAKSGTGWGYSQVFKLFGQKEYLRAGNALFVVSGCESARVDRVDDRFGRLGLHAVHVPGPLSGASSWRMWQRLADRGLAASAVAPSQLALIRATRAAARRRLAEEALRRAVRNPGHSAALADAAHLMKATDDVGLHLADPGARLLALWSMRDFWRRLGSLAAEEETQGAGAYGRTPEGERILSEAGRLKDAYPLVQAMQLAALRVQLDILLALTEMSVGCPSRYHIDELPQPLRNSCRLLQQLSSPQALPWLAQQTVWHWGGTLQRPDLPALAADAALPADVVFGLLRVANQLYSNWYARMPPEDSLRRRNKRREKELLAEPVVRVSGTPGLLNSIRRRVRAPRPSAKSEQYGGG